jgi:YD repeat-containing protein
MQRRNATTLIEVVGTLGLLLLLAVSAASILGAITDVGLRDSRARQGRASVERLADMFRRDVHDAQNITLTEDRWPIDLSTENGAIRYEWDELGRSIRRRVSREDVRLGVDQFQLTAGCDPRVSVSDELVTVLLNPGQTTSPWIIEARRP